MEPGAKLALGGETTMHTKAGRHHHMKVVELDEGHSFTLETSPMLLARFRFHCSVEPGDAGTVIRQGVSMSGLVGSLMSATGGDRVAAGFEGILDSLATAASESGPEPK